MTLLKWAEVDLSALAHNARWVASALAPGRSFCAVVKANGYGHGAVEVARVALKAGASCLGVRDLSEAAQLRRAGLRAPVLLLAPILPEQAPEAVRLGVEVSVDGPATARALSRAAGRRRVAVHLDLDYGLGRWGAPPAAAPALAATLARLKGLRLAGVSTHIGYVPGKNSVEAEEKLGAFERLAASLKARHPGLVAHAANSSVFVDFPHRRFDMAVIGNLLYGINRSKSRPAPLKMPWRQFARVVSLREVRKGVSIGYASEYLAPRRMRVATLPVGYADGLTMEPAERLIGLGAGSRYWGLFEGVKLPFVGRVGITHCLVDATDAPRLKLGDAVALPGRRTAAAGLPRVYLR
ncbi:MAG: alanine racemase [Elusimicrobiota bacterium]|nr:alanine racemase [Elusimicrobiota bacterium]